MVFGLQLEQTRRILKGWQVSGPALRRVVRHAVIFSFRIANHYEIEIFLTAICRCRDDIISRSGALSYLNGDFFT
jgi:F420-0:gamma-glutamyl ligase-like protein